MRDTEEFEGEIDPKHVLRFVKIAKDMDKLLNEIAEYCPGINLYLANELWCLMTGHSHDDSVLGAGTPRQDRVVERVNVKRSGGGDF